MIAIREIHNVISDIVTVRLPANFTAKRVEIIILSLDEEVPTKRRQLQELLLAGPTLTDEELDNYNSVREWMDQWNLPNF